MKLASKETSLVIAGAWNPAILTPAWFLQHGLSKSLDEVNSVQTFFPISQGSIFELPRYVLEDLSFIVRPDSLILFPPESTDNLNNSLNNLEMAAAAILGELKHTPMSGVGHNFTFIHTNPDSNELDVFTNSAQDISDGMPEDWSAASYSLSTSFTNSTETVVVNIQRQFEANAITVKFNFHHPLNSIDSALIVLRGENQYKRMFDNLELAKQLMIQLYGECEDD
jgi:hypothetical protein